MPTKKEQVDTEREQRKQYMAKLAQVNEILPHLQDALRQSKSNRTQLNSLSSVSLGIYEEMDKLCKKAPAEKITNLALEQINTLIRDAKQLVASDPYMQRLVEFVPAGDNPELRDVVLVLRQIREGLHRFEIKLNSKMELLRNQISDAQCVRLALQLHSEGKFVVSSENIEKYEIPTPSKWFSGAMGNGSFIFSKVDKIDFKEYFNIPE